MYVMYIAFIYMMSKSTCTSTLLKILNLNKYISFFFSTSPRLQADLQLHVERLVQSVKALCSSLAAVETPDITSALNQLPACPCRLQPRVQKVNTHMHTDTNINTCGKSNMDELLESSDVLVC